MSKDIHSTRSKAPRPVSVLVDKVYMDDETKAIITKALKPTKRVAKNIVKWLKEHIHA